MSDPSMPERESLKINPAGGSSPPGNGISPRTIAESDLAELAAVFATHGGGGLSPQVSADLALEIVLNEIVEQARLAIGGTGAAIALVRNEEMVCRASSGVNAPEIGVRLNSEFGLTAECVRTRQVQRCDDAQADLRADAEASRSLGVRSVVIVPVIHKGNLVGVLEVFSSRPAAFGERDEITLKALSDRILKSLDEANATLTGAERIRSPEPVLPASTGFENSVSSLLAVDQKKDKVAAELLRPFPRKRFDVVSIVLGTAIVICAVLLGILLGVRMGWTKRIAVANRQSTMGQDSAVVAGHESVPAGAHSVSANPEAAPNSVLAAGKPTTNANMTNGKEKNAGETSKGFGDPTQSKAPAGSLLVYENGKEIFRMLPGAEGGPAKGTAVKTHAATGESTLQRAGMIELSPKAAEENLVHRVEPDYPEAARQQKIQGSVVLNVRIGGDGSIQEVNVLSGQSVLADAAIAAVKQWRFKPRMVAGRPVEMQTRITLNFKMST